MTDPTAVSGFIGLGASGADARTGRKGLALVPKRERTAIAMDSIMSSSSSNFTTTHPATSSSGDSSPHVTAPTQLCAAVRDLLRQGQGSDCAPFRPAADLAPLAVAPAGEALPRSVEFSAPTEASIAEFDGSRRWHPPKSSLKRRLSSLSLSDSLTGSDFSSDGSAESAIARSASKPKRHVRFTNSTTRVHGRTMGDHPFSSFPSLALDWCYDPHHIVVPVEDHEARRRSEGGGSSPERLDVAQRLCLLMDVGGFTAEELAQERQRHNAIDYGAASEQDLWCGALVGWKDSWQKKKADMRRKVLIEDAERGRKKRSREAAEATAAAVTDPVPKTEASPSPPTVPDANNGSGNVNPTKRSWRKPKDKPKRPLSAYNLFFRQERERMIAEMGSTSGAAVVIKKGTKRKAQSNNAKAGTTNAASKAAFVGMTKSIAQRWNLLDKEARAPFERMAADEKERYKMQIALWNDGKEAKDAEAKQLAMEQAKIRADVAAGRGGLLAYAIASMTSDQTAPPHPAVAAAVRESEGPGSEGPEIGETKHGPQIEETKHGPTSKKRVRLSPPPHEEPGPALVVVAATQIEPRHQGGGIHEHHRRSRRVHQHSHRSSHKSASHPHSHRLSPSRHARSGSTTLQHSRCSITNMAALDSPATLAARGERMTNLGNQATVVSRGSSLGREQHAPRQQAGTDATGNHNVFFQPLHACPPQPSAATTAPSKAMAFAFQGVSGSGAVDPTESLSESISSTSSRPNSDGTNSILDSCSSSSSNAVTRYLSTQVSRLPIACDVSLDGSTERKLNDALRSFLEEVELET